MSSDAELTVSFLSTEIGRGHPYYLEGLLHAFEEILRTETRVRGGTVFELSKGLSLLAWKGIRTAYRFGARGGFATRAYQQIRARSNYNQQSALLSVLGRDLRRWAGEEGILVVAHPLLVGALRDRKNIWYLHGEMVAPRESMVSNADRVLVPTEDTAIAFSRHGYPRSRILVTGLCVEPELTSRAAEFAAERKRRLAFKDPLTLGFFSSGAEPVAHVRAMVAGVVSAVLGGHRSIVFAARGGRLERAIRRRLPSDDRNVEIVLFSQRKQLDRVTAERFSEIDVIVSPPHERSNWAVGLCVPFLLVGPDIGPYPPLQRSLLLRKGVAAEISRREAGHLAELVDRLRKEGRLIRMLEASGGVPVDGFRRAAEFLIEELDRRQTST